MNTTLSSPFPTLPVFVICMKSDGDLMQSFFAQAGYKVDSKDLLSGLEGTVNQFRPAMRQNDCAANSPESQSAILALEAYLGENLRGQAPFAWITMNYEEIRKFSLMAEFIRGNQPPLLVNWLIENQLPVIHLVRKNALDCFVEQLVKRIGEDPEVVSKEDLLKLDITSSVETIRQMQKDVEEFRNWLVPTNRIEFYSESLSVSNQQPSDLVAHQLSRHIGLENGTLGAGNRQSSIEGSERLTLQIKSQLRPALIRAGYENLYQMPRAA